MTNNQFNKHIAKRLELKNKSILLFAIDVSNLNSEVKVPRQQNICCVDDKGEILWWVEGISDFIIKRNPGLNIETVREGWKNLSQNNVWFEDGVLKSFVSDGYVFRIDVKSGQIIDMESEKN